MMKILQTGIDPKQISALVYQHHDPDLCGSMSNMIEICENPDLKILSDANNNIFITYYIERKRHYLLEPIDKYGYSYTFNGRTLQFFQTPYCHSTGSFVTYDSKTKTLFSSDLFGSFSKEWDLFIQFDDECISCNDFDHCVTRRPYCPLPDIVDFHRKIMPSDKALKYAMDIISHIDIDIIAPQHGSVFTKKSEINSLIKKLSSLTQVGIDALC
jgi:flavorubredoxin